ncbi:MAG: superoxide dismutase [Bacteroidia bacterium]|nr:superoxide dismutase [Bacteroidia bacterium]
MNKRDFLKISAVLGTGIFLAPGMACKTIRQAAVKDKILSEKGVFVLPPLPYATNVLAPHIDAKTMEIHHDKHHGGYVKKLNEALSISPLKDKSLGEIFQALKNNDKETAAIRNNGGGHFNHSLFWSILSPAKSEMSEKFKAAVIRDFQSTEALITQLKDSGTKRFGSGWVWLCVAPDGKLFVLSTPNQDNPLMMNIAERTGTPVLGIDVWEHAYYLNYQNQRGKYLDAIFNVLNWAEISGRYESAIG